MNFFLSKYILLFHVGLMAVAFLQSRIVTVSVFLHTCNQHHPEGIFTGYHQRLIERNPLCTLGCFSCPIHEAKSSLTSCEQLTRCDVMYCLIMKHQAVVINTHMHILQIYYFAPYALRRDVLTRTTYSESS